MKSFLAAVLGVFSALYLLNPGLGIFELLPDHLPFFGNLDEAAAVAILFAVLRHFGVDFGRFLERRRRPDG